MGTVLASAVIRRASELAEDEDNTTWRSEQALDWLNEAQQAICLAKTDACSIVRSILLQPGTKQRVAGRKLMKVIRNMGADGNTPGRSINRIDMSVLDQFDPNWHTATSKDTPREWMVDERDDTLFYLSPPIYGLGPVYIEVLEAIHPPGIGDIDDPVDVGDEWIPACVEWLCYRFFGRDSEQTPNNQRSKDHLANFASMVGTGWKSEVMVSEEAREA